VVLGTLDTINGAVRFDWQRIVLGPPTVYPLVRQMPEGKRKKHAKSPVEDRQSCLSGSRMDRQDCLSSTMIEHPRHRSINRRAPLSSGTAPFLYPAGGTSRISAFIIGKAADIGRSRSRSTRSAAVPSGMHSRLFYGGWIRACAIAAMTARPFVTCSPT
jgi:hypothetical protein